MTDPKPTHPTDGPIHEWFSLSYSNYQVLHRTLMQSMPTEWQERMVACLAELSAAYQHIEQPECFEVHAATEHIVWEMTESQLYAAGVLVEGDGPDGPGPETRYHSAHDGREVDAHERVLIPTADPIPHYNRGRTYIEPRTPCARCKGTGVDPENTAEESYGDVVRELPEPCSACQLTAAAEGAQR